MVYFQITGNLYSFSYSRIQAVNSNWGWQVARVSRRQFTLEIGTVTVVYQTPEIERSQKERPGSMEQVDSLPHKNERLWSSVVLICQILLSCSIIEDLSYLKIFTLIKSDVNGFCTNCLYSVQSYCFLVFYQKYDKQVKRYELFYSCCYVLPDCTPKRLNCVCLFSHSSAALNVVISNVLLV